MEKIDIEAKFFIFFLHLKEEKVKQYSDETCDENIVYVFNNYADFRLYFMQNGVNISDELLDICKMKITKKGTVLALKKLCDYIIKRCTIKESLINSQSSKIYVKGKNE